jgi:hypothetical protein
MQIKKTLAAVALAGLITLPLGGCASAARLSTQRMCEATGGTYANKMCNPGTPNQRSGAQICQAHGGRYEADLDTCELQP